MLASDYYRGFIKQLNYFFKHFLYTKFTRLPFSPWNTSFKGFSMTYNLIHATSTRHLKDIKTLPIRFFFFAYVSSHNYFYQSHFLNINLFFPKSLLYILLVINFTCKKIVAFCTGNEFVTTSLNLTSNHQQQVSESVFPCCCSLNV